MSTAERFSPPGGDYQDKEKKREPARELTPRPAVRRTMKRFEMGLFLRKRRFDRLAYYKELLLLRRLRNEGGVAPGEPSPEPHHVEGQEGQPMQMEARPIMMAPSQDTADGDVSPLGGPGMGDDNPGPIGGTSYEIGFFAGTTEQSTDEEPD